MTDYDLVRLVESFCRSALESAHTAESDPWDRGYNSAFRQVLGMIVRNKDGSILKENEWTDQFNP